jgi:HAD superfamily hydrolase (TIGR01549 family)
VAVRAVVFDFGYTLVDEDRVFRAKADHFGWPHSTFFAALGAVIERREDHRRVYELLGADTIPPAVPFEAGDFYEDAVDALRAAKNEGLVVGVAGNFDETIQAFLATELAVDFIASSAAWGVEKPAPEFFERVETSTGVPAREIAYVGDRVDNDVVPAARAGMAAVFLRRGPWAAVQRSWPEATAATKTIDALDAVLA